MTKEDFKKKLKGRELDFATFVAEAIIMDPTIENLEFEIAKDRLERYTKEELIKKLKDMNNITTSLYATIHSWSNHNCNHERWKDNAIDIYEGAIKHGLIHDRFGLYNDKEVEVDLGEYKKITVHEPTGKINLDWTYITNGEGYTTIENDMYPDLELVRTYNDPNRFYILQNNKGPRGCLTTIDEGKIVAIAAKNKLVEDD